METPPTRFAPLRATDLHDALTRGASLVTATNRLARGLRQAYEHRLAAAGQTTWPTPDILPWSAWLGRQFTALTDAGELASVLLSPAQERLVWEGIVGASPAGQALLRPDAAAEAAASAYRTIRDWRLDPAELLAEAGPETEVLLTWVDAFEQQCRVRGWLSRSNLPAALADAGRRGRLDLPQTLLLAGFDDYPPAQAGLLGLLTEQGTQILELADADATTGTAVRLPAADAADEMALAARWALARLRQRPEARIGIVVPELNARRDALERQLTHTLHPESLLPGSRAVPPLFEFSLGRPLADHPPVQDALLALGLLSGPQPLADVGRFLRSPHFAAAETEWAERGRVDAELRRRAAARLRLPAVLRWTRDPCPRLHRALRDTLTLADQLPAQVPPSAWAEQFDRLLRALGWPGERPLDSAEYQQVQRFRDLYAEFAALDRVSGTLRYPQALAALRRLAADTLFQPEGRGAPIQVLGALEAGGLRFDHLWVMGLDDSVWPPAAAPHPLLPAALQRRLGLPHASAERELAFAGRLTARLRGAAPEVVFSHPLRDGERELRPSPLLDDLPEADAATLALAPAASPWLAAPATPLETVPDAQAPPAPPNVRGGTGLIASQAACPFSAVAGFRLAAQPLEEPQHTPDGRQTGSLVHRALQLLWGGLGGSEALTQLPPEELRAAVDTAAQTALNEVAQERPDLYPQHFLALEQARLVALLQSWLELERGRAPFTIGQLEDRADVELAGLRLKIRADRIDTLADGRLVVIDYKTGRGARPGDWTGDRPDQPQVPLYCIASANPVAAAVIARVRNGDCALTGMAAEDDLLPGVRAFAPTETIADWPGLLSHWRERLHALASEVHEGLAVATPSPIACEYCPFPALCRREDTAHLIPEADDDDA